MNVVLIKLFFLSPTTCQGSLGISILLRVDRHFVQAFKSHASMSLSHPLGLCYGDKSHILRKYPKSMNSCSYSFTF